MSQDTLSKIEQDIVRLATPLENYGTLAEAFSEIADARDRQRKAWPATATVDAGGRMPEEWALLLNQAVARLNADYYETEGRGPSFVARAATVANLAIWLIQSTIGTLNDDKRIAAGIAATCALNSNPDREA